MGKVLDRPLFRKVVKLQRGGMAGNPNALVPRPLGIEYNPQAAPSRLSLLKPAFTKGLETLSGVGGLYGAYEGGKNTIENIQNQDYLKALASLGATGLGIASVFPPLRALSLPAKGLSALGKVGKKTGEVLSKGRLGKATDFLAKPKTQIAGLGGEVGLLLAGAPDEVDADTTRFELQEKEDAQFIADKMKKLKKGRRFKISGINSNRNRLADYLGSLQGQGLTQDQKRKINEEVNLAITNDRTGVAPKKDDTGAFEPINFLQTTSRIKENTTPKAVNLQKKEEQTENPNLDKFTNNLKNGQGGSGGGTGEGSGQDAFTNLQKQETQERKVQENSDRLTPKYGLDPSTIIDKMRKLKNEEIQALKQVTRLEDKLAPREKETFEEFYKKSMAGTETDETTRRLLFMKLGMGLMTNKTTNRGISGFADVLGQSMEPVIDETMRIREREINNRRSLARAFNEMQERKLEAARAEEIAFITDDIQREREIIKTQIMGEKEIIGFEDQYQRFLADMDYKYAELERRKAEKAMNRKFNTEYQFVPYDPQTNPAPEGTFLEGEIKRVVQDTNSEEVFEMTQAVNPDTGQVETTYRPVPTTEQGEQMDKVDQKKKRLLEFKVANNAEVIKIGQYIQQSDLQNIGRAGGIRRFADNAILELNDIVSLIPGIEDGIVGVEDAENYFALDSDGKLVASERDKNLKLLNRLKEEMFLDYEAKGLTQQDALEEFENISDLFDKTFNKELKRLTNAVEGKGKGVGILSNEDRQALAKLALAETRVKFLLANSLKGEDRLTEKNIQEAGERTTIFGKAALTVRSTYKDIIAQQNEAMKQNLRLLHRQSRSPSFYQTYANRYSFAPLFSESKEASQQKITGRKLTQEEQGIYTNMIIRGQRKEAEDYLKGLQK